MKKKSLVLILAFTLILGGAIGGTIAWLVADTDPVTNTFTVGDINIDLDETGATSNAKDYDFVPGDTLSKDPKVTVKAGSEACYLFIKVTDVNNAMATFDAAYGDDKIIKWDVDTAVWTPVTGHSGYWYKIIDDKVTADTDYYILASGNSSYPNGLVTVNEGVTKAMVDDTTKGLKIKKPQIIISAAAVQKAHIASVDAAWDELPSEFKNI